ncbi:MAG: hypothetical protein M1831_005663 [Alyxoria varia]|nr:MAG: hypothetical protein M1831_005663 [Alyxoria varia]
MARRAFHIWILETPRAYQSLQVHWSLWVPLIVNAGVAELNRSVYGPSTNRAMEKNMGSKDSQGGTQGDTGTLGEHRAPDDRSKLKRAFERSHVMSIHLNAIGIIATVWYGFVLSSRIEFKD